MLNLSTCPRVQVLEGTGQLEKVIGSEERGNRKEMTVAEAVKVGLDW